MEKLDSNNVDFICLAVLIVFSTVVVLIAIEKYSNKIVAKIQELEKKDNESYMERIIK